MKHSLFTLLLSFSFMACSPAQKKTRPQNQPSNTQKATGGASTGTTSDQAGLSEVARQPEKQMMENIGAASIASHLNVDEPNSQSLSKALLDPETLWSNVSPTAIESISPETDLIIFKVLHDSRYSIAYILEALPPENSENLLPSALALNDRGLVGWIALGHHLSQGNQFGPTEAFVSMKRGNDGELILLPPKDLPMSLYTAVFYPISSEEAQRMIKAHSSPEAHTP